MRVAVDAMGGDKAPDEIVRGAVRALELDPDLSVMLVGDEEVVRASLGRTGGSQDRCSVRHASQVVEMGESPVDALRQKPDTSVQRAVEAMRAGDVDAFVSAGDTGGVVAAATMFARRLKGVKRHGIAIRVPTKRGMSLLMDVGANIHCKPIHLVQYGIMARVYAQELLGIPHPTVGLLSVGEEALKGNELVKKTRDLLSHTDLLFVGNVEGQSIFEGCADVVVCDGFVGNVILKVAEGLAETILHTIMAEVKQEENPGRLAELLKGMKSRLDYNSAGGAPLLGVEGSVIICHGRSGATAIANAIAVANEFSKSPVNQRIVEDVDKVSFLHRMADLMHRQ
jgi:glycerol-3-phosphate acyltransferase PlsX